MVFYFMDVFAPIIFFSLFIFVIVCFVVGANKNKPTYSSNDEEEKRKKLIELEKKKQQQEIDKQIVKNQSYTCPYCGTIYQGSSCPSCGAEKPNDDKC